LFAFLVLGHSGRQVLWFEVTGIQQQSGWLFKRHNISFKKKPAGCGARASGRGLLTAVLDARTGHA
jgi:hypothetical protein